MERLDTSFPNLATRITAAGAERQRRAAFLAAQWAVAVSGLDDDDVRSGLLMLGRGEGSEVDVTSLEVAVERLDEHAWSIQDAVDEGDAQPEEYLVAFGQARAAGSVFFAADADPLRAALEAVYEASVVVPDPSPLLAIIESELSDG